MNHLITRCKGQGRILPIVLLLSAVILFSPSLKGQDSANYKNFSELESVLKSLEKSYNDMMKLESIGKTNEGRDIWLVTVTGDNGIPQSEKPGLLVTANLEGDHLVGSELALESIKYLLDNYGSSEEVKKALDDNVFYFLPRINPDGAEKNFGSFMAGNKTNCTPYDGDNDGRLDEDGPEDLNGDGIISVMRVQDANGLYMEDPENPGLMKKADPVKGESGKYSIYWEGVDNDGDGFINEDPAGGVDINRNFQHAYPYYQDDAGIHMVSEKETRAVLDWMLANKNIAMILSFTESDNLISAPSGGELSSDKQIAINQFADASKEGASKVGMVSTFGRGRYSMFMFGGMRSSRGGQTQQASSGRSRPSRQPATTIDKDDQEYFALFSKKYKEICGIESQPPVRKPAGAMFEYGYYQYGVPSLATPGWGMDMPKDTAQREEASERPAMGRRGSAMRGGRPGMGGSGSNGGSQGVDAAVYKWLEKNNKEGIVEWQKVDHPEFGEVEVGGFNPFDLVNPPVGMIEELGVKHGKYMVYLSTLFPDVKIAKTVLKDHGGGIFRIKAEIENTGFLPTALSHGVTSRGVKPTMVQLGVDPKAIISGSSKTSFIQKLDGSGKRQEFEWLIKAKPGEKIELKVVSQKGGSDKAEFILK